MRATLGPGGSGVGDYMDGVGLDLASDDPARLRGGGGIDIVVEYPLPFEVLAAWMEWDYILRIMPVWLCGGS